mgnify:CR=1 FL=1
MLTDSVKKYDYKVHLKNILLISYFCIYNMINNDVPNDVLVNISNIEDLHCFYVKSNQINQTA